jgi:hypothetical protein
VWWFSCKGTGHGLEAKARTWHVTEGAIEIGQLVNATDEVARLAL